MSEQTLVTEWGEQWAKLSDLLTKTFSSSNPPTDTDEITYISLRSWLLDHQDAFLRVFSDLYEAAVVSAVCVDGGEFPDPEEMMEGEGYGWNPYHWYYREPDIYKMAEDNRLLTSLDSWEPNKDEVGDLRFTFEVIRAMMGKLKPMEP
jgi:hypothetical protein